MKLISCDACGLVYDLDKVPRPTESDKVDQHGQISLNHYYWDGDGFNFYFNCRCGCEVNTDEPY